LNSGKKQIEIALELLMGLKGTDQTINTQPLLLGEPKVLQRRSQTQHHQTNVIQAVQLI
jgi:hypothetical protein